MCIEISWNVFDVITASYQTLVVTGGIAGLIIAGWRARTADENRLQEQYKIAVEMLGTPINSVGGRYATRVAGLTIFQDLALKHPKKYDALVIKTFKPMLAYHQYTQQEHHTQAA